MPLKTAKAATNSGVKLDYLGLKVVQPTWFFKKRRREENFSTPYFHRPYFSYKVYLRCYRNFLLKENLYEVVVEAAPS